jgi:hypothetical protein
VSGPGDGYGNPLDVKMAPGWVGCFVTDADLDRLIGRPWVPVCWGDPHLKQYVGTRPGKKGEQIAFKELKLFKMSAADAAAVNANDWRRRDHIAAGRGLFDYAKSTGGRVERHEKTQTIFARD